MDYSFTSKAPHQSLRNQNSDGIGSMLLRLSKQDRPEEHHKRTLQKLRMLQSRNRKTHLHNQTTKEKNN